tara:strand:- start:20 stop:445 length:426 start_codon:yes stop_codon:yes gene_type:complete
LSTISPFGKKYSSLKKPKPTNTHVEAVKALLAVWENLGRKDRLINCKTTQSKTIMSMVVSDASVNVWSSGRNKNIITKLNMNRAIRPLNIVSKFISSYFLEVRSMVSQNLRILRLVFLTSLGKPDGPGEDFTMTMDRELFC